LAQSPYLSRSGFGGGACGDAELVWNVS